MKFLSEKITKENKGKYSVEFDIKEWSKIIQSTEVRIQSGLQIPGFRKGKVPKEIAKKHINEDKILSEAHKKAIDEAWKFALSQNDELKPFSTPSIIIDRLSREEYAVSFEFDLQPEINLETYTNIKIDKPSIEVNDEDIEKSLKELQERLAILSPKEGTISKGDIVVFDFEGFKDGKPFAGGKAENYSLEIGSQKFIPGFEEQMIGINVGEEKDLQVTFPKDYLQKDLAGKEVIFKVKINEIQIKTLPEIDDDLAKEANIENVASLEELKNFIKENLLKDKELKRKETFIQQLLEKITEKAQVHISESVIEKEIDSLQKEFEKKLSSQNITLEQYKELTKLTEEDIRKELYIEAKNRIIHFLILDTIIKKENISVNEEEINEEIIKFAKTYNMELEEAKKKITDFDFIKDGLKQRKVLEFLYTNNG